MMQKKKKIMIINWLKIEKIKMKKRKESSIYCNFVSGILSARTELFG